MAKTKAKRRFHKGSIKVPISLVVGLVPTLSEAIKGWKQSGPNGVLNNVSAALTGYSPLVNKFQWFSLKYGLLPLAMGAGVHLLANYAGINRALGRARIPFLRV